MKEYIEKRESTRIINIDFSNLSDLYDYLKSDPTVNKEVFTRQASLDSDTGFHGESLDKAIEYCLGGYTKGFDNFLEISNKLKKAGTLDVDSRALKRGLYGGIPLSSLVASGVPDCMLRYDRNEDVRHITVYFNLGYPCFTSEREIINRGLSTIYLIEGLEERGYIVDFKAFELSSCGDEIVNININLKKPGDLFLNIEKCYYPMKGKEFLRRVLFRVLESSSVIRSGWECGYGSPLSTNQIKKFYNANDKDLIINYPETMNIKGTNIYDDTMSLITKLNLEEEFNTEQIKRLAKEYR